MLNTYFTGRKITILNILLLLLIGYHSHAQVYYHNFGTSAISTHPYTVPPPIIDSHLSGSSWTNSVGSWTSNPGAGATTAITMLTAPGINTITLTFNVAGSYQLEVTSFDFWRQRSSIGPTTWALAINGTNVGNGTTPTVGAPVGATNVSTPITGLTGTVTVTLTLTGATGGNFRLDDFTLNGVVTSNCTAAVISSFLPVSGPANTIVTINGTGFTNATAVKFNGVNTTSFTVISDTTIKATVPATATTGIITITANGCDGSSTGSFNVLTPSCTNNFSEIFISELYDQESGNGGMIEIYNPTSASIDLSSYVLQRYGNISDATPTSGYILTLSGILAPGATHLIASAAPNPAICAAPTANQTMGNGFNGNDKFELLKNGVVIDRVDVPFTGPGYTLIRKPNAIAPVSVYNVNDWNNTQHPNDVPGVPNTFCQNLGVHTITPTPIPTITHPASATVCENGSTTYTVAVNPSTGFTYQWKVLNSAGIWTNITNNTNYSGATTNSLTVTQIPLSFNANQYYCEITSSACVLVSNAAQLVVNPAPPVATATTTQPTCTTATGSITITAPTGTGLTYSINGTTFQPGLTFNNLAPGSYTITVRNSNNCMSVSLPIVINSAPGAPAVANTTVTQPDCTTTTGTIVVNTPTGTGITYSIDGTTFQAGTTFANLTPGNYSVTVNSGGCTSVTSPITINTAPASPAIGNTTVTQPTCTTPTGTIVVNTPIGTGLTYSINGTTFQAGTTFANLTPGSYTITVNSGGCTSVTTPITINTVPSAPTVANTTVTQPDCTTATGTIVVNSPLGTGITYSIDGTTFQAGTTFANLIPGNYTVTVNSAGCTSVTSPITINTAPASPAVANTSVTQPTCTTPTGTIVINSPTGTGLTYSIDGTNFQTGTSFNNLAAGSYNITVMSTTGCTSVTTPITINSVPSAPAVANTTVTQPNCTITTGTITTNTPTGTGLTYSIDGTTFQTGTSFTGLTQGSYTITVMNTAGCTSVTSPIIINSAPITPAIADITVTQPTCTTPTGTIVINSPTGTGLTYSIEGANFQTGTSFTNLAPGSYSVIVMNASGCTSATSPIVINTAPAIPSVANTNVIQPNCTTPTGSITVNSPVGTGLTYSIDGATFQANPSFVNLIPGTYNITVQNTIGCTSVTNPITINTAPTTPAVATVTTNQPTCTTNTGTVTVSTPTGAGITYSINGTVFQSSPVFNGLPTGTYHIIVQNAVGCTSVTPDIIINPAPPVPAVASVTVTQPTCTVTTGTITINTPIGTGIAYSIDGTNFQSSTTFSNLAPGNYQIITQNTAGCTSQTGNITVNPVPAPPAIANVTVVQPKCTAATGSITINSPLGTGLTYSINGIDYLTNPVFNNVLPGTYNITVRANPDCTSLLTGVVINNPPGGLPPIAQPTPVELCDPNNDGFEYFDLTNTIQAIQNALSDVNVTIHETPQDAEFNVNPVPNTNQYLNLNYAGQTLYIRVSSNTTDCYDIVTVQLIVNPTPVATAPADYELCDDGTSDTDGIATFNLNTKAAEIYGTLDPAQYSLAFYADAANAAAGTNAITNPMSYQSSTATVYARVTNTVTGCYDVVALNLIVNPLP
ncbi:beta strand repeat-containing protein, partial [Flavobacterium sp. AG291]|uniref:beta strand repeat-containing protein n=1 Tax=Flavobacterium sp. AG291 TaxID=2184000 RepID=UPI0013142305